MELFRRIWAEKGTDLFSKVNTSMAEGDLDEMIISPIDLKR